MVPEPVDRWQNVGNHNLLDKFYHDKERYAYTFQNYIFFTRMMQEQDSARAMTSQPYRLLERSIFCDRMVFVESLKDSNILSEMELSIYDSWCASSHHAVQPRQRSRGTAGQQHNSPGARAGLTRWWRWRPRWCRTASSTCAPRRRRA